MLDARRPPSPNVPTYQLYGEKNPGEAEFWLHCETLRSRTELHNWEIVPHRHEAFFQLFLVSSGSGEIIAGAETQRFGAPCALFIPPRAVHGFRFSRDAEGLVVTALADRLASIAATERSISAFAASPRIVPLADGDAPGGRAADTVARIHAELAGHAPGRGMLLEALVVSAVVELVRAAEFAPAARDDLRDRDRRRLAELDALIGAHFRERRPVSFYAERLGVSPTHLNRLTRAAAGTSVQEQVTRRVLEAARRDLVFTPTPVQAIAYSLGFADPAYFNRFFRKRTGSTPGAFRREERRRLAV